MTSPSRRYKRVDKTTPEYKLHTIRERLFKAFQGGVLTLPELKEKLSTIGGFTYPLHIDRWIARRSEPQKTTLSLREQRRRALISFYSKGHLTEDQLLSMLDKLFLNDGTHHENQTTITTTKDKHLYIANRSRKFQAYLLREFPSLYSGMFQPLARPQPSSTALAKLFIQLKEEQNNEG